MDAATASSSGSASPSGRPKRRGGNNLLRDYYGLGQAERNGVSGSTTNSIAGVQQLEQSSNPIDPDGSAFNVDLAFQRLLQKHSLAQLLKEESDLLTNIRELDGERQSLVYNHHHELVSASETMRKMKERADSLLPSLNSLQASLQDISSATNSLMLSTDTTTSAAQATASSSTQQQKQQQEERLALAARTAPIVQLPQRLRDLILLEQNGKSSTGLAKAQGLWGSMEAVLASWDEAGVRGARDIMNECRTVLREAQQSAKG